jgi:hypothetical protein
VGLNNLSLDSQTVEAPDSGLAFQDSYGLDGTFASLMSSEQAALETDVQQAESDLSSEFTNSVTLNIDVEAVNVPLVDGSGFIASNAASTDVAAPCLRTSSPSRRSLRPVISRARSLRSKI